MPAALTTAAFVLHISGGFVALVAGFIAIFAPKGGRTHRTAGKVFLIAMLVMGAFAAVLAVVRPGQLVNLFIATLALYLVTTSWLAASRGDGRIGHAERGLMLLSLVLWAPFAVLAFQLAGGMAPFSRASSRSRVRC